MQNEMNKMGTMPVPKLLWNMGAPIMFSMLGQALYNVVDSFFVSHMPDTAAVAELGDKAIRALTLAFPIQMLIIALGVGTGVGVNAALSGCLGRRDREGACRTAGNALFVSACYYAAILLFGLLGVRAFIGSQTTDPDVAAMGIRYLQIVTIGAFGCIGFMCLEKFLIATGDTVTAMLAQLAGAVVNTILDPIMIFGLLGCPAMGVAGAAIATVIGQCVGLTVALAVYLRRAREVPILLRCLRPDRTALRRIYAVGAPAILMQLLSPVMTYGMNLILGSVSAAAVTAYGLYYKLQNFIFMPAYGLNNAVIPIVSYNRGAGQKARITSAIRCGLFAVSLIMVLGILLLQLFAHQIVGIFAVAPESASLCVTALRIVTCGFLFAGVNIILQGVCQALGSGLSSLAVSLLRLLVVVLPLAWALSRLPTATTAVWFALPAAEASACVCAILLTRRVTRLAS
ncbi:MAG: MATE family efflux transporter [Oscillospiraceae bacterium]|nr:MATE family efflux transporter [Oscillospiraceae bacterium]